MHSLTPLIFSMIMISLLAGIYLLLLKFLNRPWWSSRRVRWFSIGLPLAGIFWTVMWWLAVSLSIVWFRNLSVIFVGLVMVMELSLIFTLPVSSVIRSLGGWLMRLLPHSSQSATVEETDQVDLGRRKALGALAATVPLGALAMSAGGFGRALAGANVYEREMAIAGLPDEFKGLKIFHISDIHLGPFVKLGDLEEVVSEAAEHRPDLVLITGDIADEITLLPEAMRLIDQLKPRLGSFASMGNHEHFRGATEVRRMIDRSQVRLLINEGLSLPGDQASIYLTAIDDPRRMRADHTEFFRGALDEAMLDSGSDETVILMSHRPSVFDLATEYGVDLTLAGHTHGGQMGLMGRSIFETYAPEEYLWGPYAKGSSRLYTSAGMGHWFPFRLGCPPEAPIIKLV